MLVIHASAVAFDLDGTLTNPLLDFPAIRRDMGLPPGLPILEALAALPPAARLRAAQVLDAHEDLAAERATPAPGALDLLASLDASGIPWGILTRNSRRSLDKVLAAFSLAPKVALSRDDAPAKPDPQSLATLWSRLTPQAHRPHGLWMVGDGHHDLEVAHATGIGSILVGDPAASRGVPFTHCVGSLAALKFLRI
jgi:HAD superfamily hydrolase (TIGR01549 family)